LFVFKKKQFMEIRHLIITGFVLPALISCTSGEKHFITDASYRRNTEKSLDRKKSLFADQSLFSVFDREMSVAEREALTFLYAFMPVGDIADYDGDFYLANVRATFDAREAMPWGKQIPEVIFRHFVLPVRINNENLDESRMVFYKELAERVKTMSLEDAVLEVNHWCHEKVVYSPSDARTSSPLASVRSATGRCGEESTFTVAALRSVGIPARQVYTPRWAHTDDNHAWVEAWIDGKWYFLGACEPEPVLNMAWFNAPARRGMLMHTKVFGRYDGPEEIMETTECYTEINVIDNYAPTAKTTVTVTDKEGKPIEGAIVEFKLYNYAEFYTVARKTTDRAGQCSLSAGKGDMLAWATKDGNFGFRKISFGKDDLPVLIIDKQPGDEVIVDLDIVPPVEGTIPAEATEEQKAFNANRLREEDEIRNVYTATFYTEEKAAVLAEELGFQTDEIKDFLLKSRGNWAEVERFLRDTPAGLRPQAIALLNVISAKDLRDTPASVLSDCLNHTPSCTKEEQNSEIYRFYVLNPRVANELLTPYKGYIFSQIDREFADAVRENPQTLVEWVKQSINIHDELNPQRIPMMPIGVWKARIADERSRNIFFVAVARTLGIPARIDRVTSKVQYYRGQWMDVNFDAMGTDIARQGKVQASYIPVKSLENPNYYTHFTVAKINDDAQLQTLNFSRGAVDMGDGNTWAGLMKNPIPIDEGNYLMVSGARMADGKVLARISSFVVKAGETTSVTLVMRESSDDIQVIGNMDPEAKFIPVGSNEETSILQATGRGYFVLAILGARQEPTNHAIRDIVPFKNDFEQWNRSMIFLFRDQQNLQQFDEKEFGTLPYTIKYGVDRNGQIENMLAEALKLSDFGTLPIFVIADTFGRIVFVSQGYTIGLGEQMIKVIRRL